MVPRPVPQSTPSPLIPQYFAGREVFITGATGFMGKVLVERLLWTCPDVAKLHLLLRLKKEVPPEKRLKELKQSPVFDVIRENCPQQLEKLGVVEGDITKPELGLNKNDIKQLSKVSIVFHSAATVKFDEPLGVAVEQNLRSVLKVMDICNQLPKIQVLVYVSTAYSNAELTSVEERVYPAPIPLAQLLTLVDNLPQHLVSQLTPGLISPKPNTYIFTKAMAESVVAERAHDLNYATIIFRPSTVVSSIQTPFPGWIENFNGPSGVVVGTGKGVLHIFHGSRDKRADMIPVDIAIDVLIAAAWEAGLENSRETKVYNCCSHDNPTTWGEFKDRMMRGVREYPFDGALWYPFGYLTDINTSVIKLAQWALQVAPLHSLNFVYTMLGIKMRPSLATVCHRLRAMNDALKFFATREWHFSTDNVRRLRERLAPADAAVYNLDVQTIDWVNHCEKFVQGIRRYLLREPDRNTRPARLRMRLLCIIHRGIQCIIAFYMCLLVFRAVLVVL